MSRFLQYFNVLGSRSNSELLRAAVAQCDLFSPSRTSPNKRYPDWRRSSVIYHDQFAIYATLVEQAVRSRLPEVLSAFGMASFDIASFELQLTSHNDGQYYRWHTDNGTEQTASRAVTFVLYFSAEPRRFSGGQLKIYDGEVATIDPINDSMVLFPSSVRHEVMPVVCPSGRFEDGRFTINGWVHRKLWALPRQSRLAQLDQRIFGPLKPQRPPSAGAAAGRASAAATARDSKARFGHVIDATPPPQQVQPQSAMSRSDALVDFLARLHRQSRYARRIPECAFISAQDFFDQYYFANRPLIMRGVTADSPAVRNWTPESLASRHGEVLIDCTAGRDQDPDYELHYQETVRRMTLSEFVLRMREPESGKKSYIVARNHFFDHPALAGLRDELSPPAAIVDSRSRSRGAVKLWMGGPGTVTPLHHDEHSIMFAQVYGHKRFKMIPPHDYPNLYVRERFYSRVDPERPNLARYPRFAQACVAEVTLGPGDALFIPAGWWHHVRALEASISATFSVFHVEGGNTRFLTPS